jgi:hypothetical protein
MINRFSNINPKNPTERLPLGEQIKLEHQPRMPLVKMMREALEELGPFIDDVLDDDRIMQDGMPRYPSEVKTLIRNGRQLVLDERKQNWRKVGEALRVMGF